MSAGQLYEYLWTDPKNPQKKQMILPACEYIDMLMQWVENLVQTEDIFPQKVST
jgi:MOB kinase activator 1